MKPFVRGVILSGCVMSLIGSMALIKMSTTKIRMVTDTDLQIQAQTGLDTFTLAPPPWMPWGVGLGIVGVLGSLGGIATAALSKTSFPQQQPLSLPPARDGNTQVLLPPTPYTPYSTPSHPLRANTIQNSWIRDFLLDTHGNWKNEHIHFCAPTQSGKSTLGEECLRIIRSQGEDCEIVLVNPKHIASKLDWSVPPICTSIDEALEGIQFIKNQIQQRVTDPQFNLITASRLIAIVEEWDWIYAEYKSQALKLLRPIFKVGAGVKLHLFLIGQSSLTDTGLNGADYRNMGRLILGTEAIAFLQNPQFLGCNAASLLTQAQRYQNTGKRFCLAIPKRGQPFVTEIPYLIKPTQSNSYQPNSSNGGTLPTNPGNLSSPESTHWRNSETSFSQKNQPPDLPLDVLKAEFLYSLPSPHPQHDQPLEEPLKTIWTWAKQRGKISARDVQQAKLKALEGMNAEDIRMAFFKLTSLKRGQTFGEGSSVLFEVW